MAQDAASRYRGAYGSSAASAGPNTLNNFQFTQMGLNAGLSTGNPYVAAIGTIGGFLGDLSLGRKRKLEADRNLMNSISQDAYNAQVAANPNPYTQDGGYEQAMSFSRGGTVKRFYGDGGPIGHVIPAERAGKAVADAAKAGIDLQKPASKTGHQEGVIPGDGHPKADDKLMTPGGRPIQVSSGEVYVDDDTMRRMAEAVGVGIGSYAKMMYPDTQHGDGFANGGPVDPPRNKQAYADSLTLYNASQEELKRLMAFHAKGSHTDKEWAGFFEDGPDRPDVAAAFKRLGSPKPVDSYFVDGPTTRAGVSLFKKPTGFYPQTKRPAGPMKMETRQSWTESDSEGRAPLGPTEQQVPNGPRKGGFASADALRYRVGPGNRELAKYADGGPVRFAPEGIPPDWRPSNPYGIGQYASAAYVDLLGNQLFAPERSFANFKEKREPVPERMNVRGMEASPLKPELKGVTKSASLPAAGSGAGRSNGTEAMRKANNIAFGANLALGTASLIHNAVQKGPVIPKPPAYEPEKVDLKTTALKAELDRRRTSGVATAGYALSNKQGLGRDLGLRSMDLSQRSQDALAVETVENQERSANTQIENQARLYNNQSLQRWMERDQEAQMNFRREKGDRMSMSLAGISDATSGWASGNQQIGAMGQMNDFNDRYLRYLSGNSETMQWDGSTIYFGDGTSTKRVERGVKLYNPQDYKYVSNRFIR